MEQKVSIKSTKNQIMDGYNELLRKLQSQKTEEPKKVQEQQQKIGLTDKAKSLSNQGIVEGIANLKVSVSAELDKLGDKFAAEYKKFEELQQAITIEKQNLEDLYQLSANTDSLAVMLLAQKEKREQFEQEMEQRKQELTEKINTEKDRHETEITEKRSLWKKEQTDQILVAKEEAIKIKKEREREEEEYKYTLKINRKKEIDLYEEKKQKLEKELAEKKAAFEKEFTERKAAIEAAETELLELRKKNTGFPTELEKAVNNAIKSTVEKMETTHKFEVQLREKEVEGELKLKEQTILAMNGKIKEMENNIKEMSQKTAKAETSVKDIAMKAIESSSKQYIIERSNEGKKE
jgi:hypothetical protein